MSKATSTFLQGANAANAAVSGTSASPPRVLDEAEILAAVENPEAKTLISLAGLLGVGVEVIQSKVGKLAKQGLIEVSGRSLKLSEAGERALRYTSLAKF